MPDSDDEIRAVYREACEITGMICMRLAGRGEDFSRARLLRELCGLARVETEKTGECRPALIFAAEQLMEPPP